MQKTEIWNILSTLKDPEIPAISLIDLGIIRNVSYRNDEWIISIVPTYSGCPATQMIEESIREALRRNNIDSYQLDISIDPPWTTDFITEKGREDLRAYGIAPPTQEGTKRDLFSVAPSVKCPRCGAKDTKRKSEFGSTPCKSLYQCGVCKEPFEYFKCL